ncbi:HNH endonuclease [Salinimicrobium soli]|uniref:HNH endonuclease n=1 Tax=Salinimicrobium soli TaxID=1254399 RepID=UPI003AAA776A
MDKALLIKNICGLLLEDRKQDCIDMAMEKFPFVESSPQKSQYSRYQMCRVFLRDGFIDRYSGNKLLFPGLIKTLTIEFPDIFKYHRNWKMSDTHMIYWDLFPTIDHLIPLARGGKDIFDNRITTSMIRNSAKSNWTIEEIGWALHPKGHLDDWDGLVHYFLELTNKNPYYEKDNYVRNWKGSLLRAMDGIYPVKSNC